MFSQIPVSSKNIVAGDALHYSMNLRRYNLTTKSPCLFSYYKRYGNASSSSLDS
jgi:hypothetical protein